MSDQRCHWACSEPPTHRVEMHDGSWWLVCERHVEVERRVIRPQRYGRIVPLASPDSVKETQQP